MGELNKSADPRIVEWLADVTGDGKPDLIVVDLTEIMSDMIKPKDNVRIYSGKTKKLIWSRKVSTEHVGQSGIYLYNDGKKYYILVWEPYMDFGRAMYHYEIIKLNDTGKEQVLKSRSFGFTLGNILKDDAENLKAFANDVNQYLKNSMVLLDTNNFQTIFSTELYKAINIYNPLSDLKIMEEAP